MPEQTNHSRPRAHNLLDEDERFPPLPPRDYVGRRPLQALVNRPMFRPQPPMAWQTRTHPLIGIHQTGNHLKDMFKEDSLIFTGPDSQQTQLMFKSGTSEKKWKNFYNP